MKASKGTIIRTVVLVIALVNQALTAFGKNPLPVENDDIENFLTIIFTVSASLIAWWKNNSFTKEAVYADTIMNYEKDNR